MLAVHPAVIIVPIALAVLALVIVGAVWAHRAEKQRQAELAAFAAARGWTFRPQRDDRVADDFRQFELFRRGDDRFTWNQLHGPVTVGDHVYPALVADYHYEESTGTGDDRRTTSYRLSFLLLRLPFAVPDLQIRREGFFDRVKAAFGFDDIDFESAEFSRRFLVRSSDKRFAYDVITPAMMELLLHRDAAGDLPPIDLRDGHLLLEDGRGRRWSVAEIEAMLAFVTAFFGNWPRHVLQAASDR